MYNVSEKQTSFNGGTDRIAIVAAPLSPPIYYANKQKQNWKPTLGRNLGKSRKRIKSLVLLYSDGKKKKGLSPSPKQETKEDVKQSVLLPLKQITQLRGSLKPVRIHLGSLLPLLPHMESILIHGRKGIVRAFLLLRQREEEKEKKRKQKKIPSH